MLRGVMGSIIIAGGKSDQGNSEFAYTGVIRNLGNGFLKGNETETGKGGQTDELQVCQETGS
jgi:hypothetical protein